MYEICYSQSCFHNIAAKEHNTLEMPKDDLGSNIPKSTRDGALQFKTRKYGRERLPMSRKRIWLVCTLADQLLKSAQYVSWSKGLGRGRVGFWKGVNYG